MNYDQNMKARWLTLKKMLKKIGALAVALTMVLSLGAVLMADGEAELTGGEVGGFAPGGQDNPTAKNKIVKLQKEIKVYNPDETSVYAPTITYNYVLEAGDKDKSITDQVEDHASDEALTVMTLAGITEGATITSSIALAPDKQLDAAVDGESNIEDILVDFTNVVFEKPGVYRYKITESLAAGQSYEAAGVTETTDPTDGHVRYLDVYVMASADYDDTDGLQAADWAIYGYVCLYENEDITPDDDTTTTGAVKTNGFVAATNDDDVIEPDSYYTFNVEITKNLTGDAYSANHKFPIQVDFTNDDVTQGTKLLATVTNPVTDYAHTTDAVSDLDGLVKIANSGSVKYIGIPCGTTVDVYETNDVAGTIFATTLTATNGTSGAVKNISATSTPSGFVAYSEQPYNSNQAVFDTTVKDTADTVAHSLVVNNVLQMISPTGIIVRTAPYILLLGAGATLFILIRVFRKKEEEA